MAIITCPECKKEISDQATNCPNCGFPLSDKTPPESVRMDSNGALPGSEGKKGVITTTKSGKRTLIICAIAIICVALIAVTAMILIKNAKQRAAMEARDTYISNLNLFASSTLSGAAKSETVCNLTKKVWYDTIYEEFEVDTIEYTKTDGKFNEDFNTSLRALYESDDIIETLAEIKTSQETVDRVYKLLLSVEPGLEKCFDAVENLYSTYHKFTNLAISPSGSLQSYAEDFGDYDDDFMEHYEKLMLLIPEE